MELTYNDLYNKLGEIIKDNPNIGTQTVIVILDDCQCTSICDIDTLEDDFSPLHEDYDIPGGQLILFDTPQRVI
jgi:hypothetical protein